MPAEIQIHEMSALDSGEDKTDDTIRFKKADNADVDFNDPIKIPDSGSEYSYTKTLRPYMAAAPDTQVENLRWYTGGEGFRAGVAVNAKNIGDSWSENSDSEMTGGSDLFEYTKSSPLDGDETDSDPFEPDREDDYIGDLIRMQMVVDDTASRGKLSSKTLTMAYDEI